MVVVEVLGTVLALLVGVGLLIAAGWWLAHEQLQAHWQRLRTARSVLDAEWRALEQTRRVRETFLLARRAMQAEADRQDGGR